MRVWTAALCACVFLIVGVGAGCGPVTVAIEYPKSQTGPLQPASKIGVSVQVRDHRRISYADQAVRVGTIYNSSGGMYGSTSHHPRAVNVADPQTITRTVEAATRDGLARAGLSVGIGDPML
ncbi:MAG TPA: hypothetical protein VIY56_19245, partial [Vicinamibacterales bacterium]